MIAFLEEIKCNYIHRYHYSGGADMWLLNCYDCIILPDLPGVDCYYEHALAEDILLRYKEDAYTLVITFGHPHAEPIDRFRDGFYSGSIMCELMNMASEGVESLNMERLQQKQGIKIPSLPDCPVKRVQIILSVFRCAH